jgi:hypothetical protein
VLVKCKNGLYCHVIKLLENLITEYRIKLVVLGRQKKLHEINSSNYRIFKKKINYRNFSQVFPFHFLEKKNYNKLQPKLITISVPLHILNVNSPKLTTTIKLQKAIGFLKCKCETQEHHKDYIYFSYPATGSGFLST